MATAHNHWTDPKCAKAFWGQHELPAYKTLLADTLDWANPGPGEDWLDLGCGGGALSRGLWERSEGQVRSVLGVDCAAANDDAYRRLSETLLPPPGDRVHFLCHDFSSGLDFFADQSFHNAVSGLSISYAESFDETTGTWNTAAYDRLLEGVCRVLRPGGRFVFSVNVPEPSWMKVGVHSFLGVFQSPRPLHFLKKSLRMIRYGAWLKREARTGRFHYLTADVITEKLKLAGFRTVEHRMSYLDQAYIFRAVK